MEQNQAVQGAPYVGAVASQETRGQELAQAVTETLRQDQTDDNFAPGCLLPLG